MTSELKNFIIDYGWFRHSCMITTYEDDPVGMHYLEYIIEVNIDDNMDSIELFKNKYFF